MMKRRGFLAGMVGFAMAPLGAHAADEADLFAAVHAGLFRVWRFAEARDECGRAYCAKTLQQARQTLQGNCLDFGLVLIDECAKRGISGLTAVWCRASGLAHLVVVHTPSGLVADNQVGSVRPMARRPDIEQARVVWAQQGLASWDGQDGRTW